MAAELLVDELGPDLLRIVGEIDTHTAPTLAERLADIPAATASTAELIDIMRRDKKVRNGQMVCLKAKCEVV